MDTVPNAKATPQTGLGAKKDARFWLLVLALSVTLFLSALDYTALSSALPVIIDELDGADFSWAGTAYALSATAFLPMSGGLAQIIGRRSSFVVALFFFALGSALCGSAKSMNWLIGARTMQGIGGGAIMSLTAIVISDLVTLQERGTYNGILGLTWAVAVSTGPLVGGAFAENGAWRWLFYLNLPVCGLAFALVMAFMDLPFPSGTFHEKFWSMDWIGNFVIAGSSTSVTLALTWAGGRYAWDQPQVLVPLVLGAVGIMSWLVYETKLATHPMVAPELIGNRTTVSGYIQISITSITATIWVFYIPVFFQACKDAGPIQSGVGMLGGALSVGVAVVLAGMSVTVFKVYRPQIWIGWLLYTAGFAALSTIRSTSPSAYAIGLSVITGVGGGCAFATAYFPVLSPLPVELNAQALALFAFFRTFAQIWGISIGSTILTNTLAHTLPPEFVHIADGGIERIYTLIPRIPTLPEPMKSEVQFAFAESLRPLWYTCTGLAVLGFIVSLAMKDVPLHNYMDEKWGLEEKTRAGDGNSDDAS